MDWLDLQRLVTALIMPLPFALALILIGGVLWNRRRLKRLGLSLIVASWLLIGLASSPWIAGSLMASLERPYPPHAAQDCTQADAIVLLGGALRPMVAGDVAPRLQRSSDRVWQAARLYHAGCAPRLLISAGGKIEPPFSALESAAIAELLTDLGVPASAQILESHSRNTQGNAAFSRAALEPLGVDRIILVTSAWHLRRAVALFTKEDFDVVPIGADYRSLRSCRNPECWVPSVEALEMTSLAIKEYIGYWIQVR